MIDLSTNRYARDWNTYSAGWDTQYGDRYRHLGDEWCDDGSAERRWEDRLFNHTVAPWLSAATRVLEIGPGGGKWTVRLAPRVAHLTVFDVADAMLQRTRDRVDAEGCGNVSYLLGNGRDLAPVPSASVDVVFSYDVFVHIALEDTFAYVADIARVLKPGGVVVLHHAVADTRAAWDRIESHNEWYRDRANTLGQYYYYSRDALDRMYARFGLRIESAWNDYCTTVITARRPADSIVPDLEQALRLAGDARDAASIEAAVAALDRVGQDLGTALARLTASLKETPHGQARHARVQQIRALIRG
jgi:ubiquinone/menaquinone biosynthesis C-methylase UbiE